MAEEIFLSDEFIRKLTAVGEVDILVGVPTLNNRRTIEQVVNAIQLGLVKYFPRERAVLINPDGGSNDGTPDVVRSSSIADFRTLLSLSPLRTIHRITTTYGSVDGSGTTVKGGIGGVERGTCNVSPNEGRRQTDNLDAGRVRV